MFDNAMLWSSLAGVIALQAVAVHWPPARTILGTGGMTLVDWGVAVAAAASVLILEEARKFIAMLFSRVTLNAAQSANL